MRSAKKTVFKENKIIIILDLNKTITIMKSKKINVQHLHRPVIFVFIIITLVPSTIIKGQSKPEASND